MKSISFLVGKGIDAAEIAKRIQAARPHSRAQLVVIGFAVGGTEQEHILRMHLRSISERFGDTEAIGVSTAGHINCGSIMEDEASLLVIWLENSTAKTHYSRGSNAFESGMEMANELVSGDSKIAIVFPSGLGMDADEFLSGFQSVNQGRIPISGALSADNADFQNCSVFYRGEKFDKGVVGLSISGDIEVFQEKLFTWHPVGKSFRIDSAQGKTAYLIDGKPAADLYLKYLGKDITEGIPETSLTFPLFLETATGASSPRVPIAPVGKDGSIEFAGQMREGGFVRFGLIESRSAIDEVKHIIHRICATPPELILIFSCMARKRYFGQTQQDYYQVLNDVSPAHGFFGFGEIMEPAGSWQEPIIYNATSTLVGLSERNRKPVEIPEKKISPPNQSVIMEGVIRLLENTMHEQAIHAEQIQCLVEYDITTGLQTKVGMQKRINQLISKEHNKNAILLFIHVTRLHEARQLYGLDVADYLLKQVASRLDRLVSSSSNLARIHEDSFALIIETHDQNITKETENIQKRINNVFSQPFIVFSGNEFHLIPRCGLTLINKKTLSANQALRHAESAAAAALNKMSDLYVFEHNLRASLYEKLETELYVKKAIKQKQLHALIQPQVAADGRLTGAELLMRINGSRRECMQSAIFINAVEGTPTIIDIGKEALSQGIETLIRTRSQGVGAPARMSVNVSAFHFQRKNFVTELEKLLEMHEYPGDGLCIEITESVTLDDKSASIKKMEKIRNLGIDISIDDFGTGHSSLSYLSDMPVSEIKIDRSFVTNLVSPDTRRQVASRKVIESILNIGEALNAKIVAEGVETQEHLDKLIDMGCKEFQGFLFSKPISKDEWLKMYMQSSQAIGEF